MVFMFLRPHASAENHALISLLIAWSLLGCTQPEGLCEPEFKPEVATSMRSAPEDPETREVPQRYITALQVEVIDDLNDIYSGVRFDREGMILFADNSGEEEWLREPVDDLSDWLEDPRIVHLAQLRSIPRGCRDVPHSSARMVSFWSDGTVTETNGLATCLILSPGSAWGFQDLGQVEYPLLMLWFRLSEIVAERLACIGPSSLTDGLSEQPPEDTRPWCGWFWLPLMYIESAACALGEIAQDVWVCE